MARLKDLVSGSVLGRYELIRRLAAGGMGEVWAARPRGDRGFRELVAIKMLLPELSGVANFEEMFLDEAKLAARIQHPNVVAVMDVGEEDGVLYQVMEWVNGESLWSLMRAASRRGGVPILVASRIVHQVCAGLHAAHELRGEDGALIGLVHRDISPQNVLVTTEGIAKVVDFGVAKFAGRTALETKSGEIRGKVPYMAPEHILGEQIDRRADIFALGLLFYQFISGHHPLLGHDDLITISRIASMTPVEPLTSRVPGISQALSDVVARALAKTRDDRTPTAQQMMRDIAAAIPESGLQSSNQVVASYMKSVAPTKADASGQVTRQALGRLDAGPPPAPAISANAITLTASRPAVRAAEPLSATPMTAACAPNRDTPPRTGDRRRDIMVLLAAVAAASIGIASGARWRAASRQIGSVAAPPMASTRAEPRVIPGSASAPATSVESAPEPVQSASEHAAPPSSAGRAAPIPSASTKPRPKAKEFKPGGL